MGCGRLLLFVLNFFVFGVGVTLVTLASIVISNTDAYTDLLAQGIMTLPIWTIVVGLIIALVGFFGCHGAMRKNKCMLYMYAIIVFALFAGQFALGVLVLVDRDGAEEAIKTAMDRSFKKYKTDDSLAKAIDGMEHDFKCCGVSSYTDWYDILGENNTVTKGCCIEGTENCYKDIPEDLNQAKAKIYTDGCYTVFIDWIKKMSLGLGIAAIILAIIQLACVFYACNLARAQ